ncbi:MAG: hypothetical protein IJQ97_03040 [Paludibacteraceae bacterium]|nr:hypothetical protein [Paludibacteraceae bacterium]
MDEIINYIKTWLLYGNADEAHHIGYTDDERQWLNYKLVIVPNGHLGKDIVMPDLSAPIVEQWSADDMPDRTVSVIRTDLIYNTFFFISRAEELICNKRDEHGRFLAAYSILGKRNRLMVPMLDEYARLLIKTLGLPLPPSGFSHIFLTHDVDTIALYRHLRGAVGGFLRGEWRQVLRSWRDIDNDPAYTFPWLIEQDKRVPLAESIFFVKHSFGKGYDYPQYNHHSHDARQLRQFLEWNRAIIGWHSSYYGVGSIEHRTKRRDELSIHRSHYLNCSIQNMRKLVELGVTDDFTMGFADKAGFRLQTSRAVLWIDPERMQLTELVLHPLTVMDVTLSNANYMNLSEDEAYYCCQRLIDKVRQHNGELCLLWHNSNINPRTYHRSLYPQLLSLLN